MRVTPAALARSTAAADSPRVPSKWACVSKSSGNSALRKHYGAELRDVAVGKTKVTHVLYDGLLDRVGGIVLYEAADEVVEPFLVVELGAVVPEPRKLPVKIQDVFVIAEKRTENERDGSRAVLARNAVEVDRVVLLV